MPENTQPKGGRQQPPLGPLGINLKTHAGWGWGGSWIETLAEQGDALGKVSPRRLARGRGGFRPGGDLRNVATLDD